MNEDNIIGLDSGGGRDILGKYRDRVESVIKLLPSFWAGKRSVSRMYHGVKEDGTEVVTTYLHNEQSSEEAKEQEIIAIKEFCRFNRLVVLMTMTEADIYICQANVDLDRLSKDGNYAFWVRSQAEKKEVLTLHVETKKGHSNYYWEIIRKEGELATLGAMERQEDTEAVGTSAEMLLEMPEE